MYELIYTSVASKDFSDQELTELLEAARVNNKNLDITGMLIYDNREIMQLLEGEEQTVKALFQKIERDPRHLSVRVFFEGPIEKRAFASWSMAFKRLDENEKRLLAQGQESLDADSTPANVIKDNPNRGKELFLSLRKML